MSIKEKLTANIVHEKLSSPTIEDGVRAFIEEVNMQSGSAGSIDLYTLLKYYLLDKNKRTEINRIVKNMS